MTEPRYVEPDHEAQTDADRDTEVKPEVISDLDAPIPLITVTIRNAQ